MLRSIIINDQMKFTFRSVCVASIVRVTTWNQLSLEDYTYTIVSPSIWSVTEQSLGITCACLPTLRPLFARVLCGGANSGGRGPLNNDESRNVQLLRLSGNPMIKKSSGDESARGFARLLEGKMTSGSVTSYATMGPKNDEGVVPKAILRSELIERHYDNMESV